MIGALLAGLKHSETPDIFRELARPAGLLGIAAARDIEAGKFIWERLEDDSAGNFRAVGSYISDDKRYTLDIRGERNISKLPGIQNRGSVTVTDESGTPHLISSSSNGAQHYFELLRRVVKFSPLEDRSAGQKSNPAKRQVAC